MDQPNISPFQSRFNVLKFNSGAKDQNSASLHSNSSATSEKNFKFKSQSKNLIDFKIEDEIMGKGIFQSNDLNLGE